MYSINVQRDVITVLLSYPNLKKSGIELELSTADRQFNVI